MQTDKINILGVKVDPLDVLTLHQKIAVHVEGDSHILVLNVNANCLNLAYKHRWLYEFLNTAEIVFCDGAGVILGAHILGYPIPQRITYADWALELAEFGVS